jgi:hypothetical protein
VGRAKRAKEEEDIRQIITIAISHNNNNIFSPHLQCPNHMDLKIRLKQHYKETIPILILINKFK